MSSPEDIEVAIRVRADTSELKRMITEFDGSVESIKKLETATSDVKTSFDSQRKAISALNQANRIQNFEIIQSLRLVRSITSTFSSLNQVYQTLLLRNIANTQQTVAQSEAYDRASERVDNYVNALDILGPANEEVKNAFDNLIDSADQLSSTQLQKLIDHIESLKKGSNLSAEEMAFLNKELDTLRKILEETKIEEEGKKWQDFFGIITAGGTAVGVLGQLALNIAKMRTGGGVGGFIGPSQPKGTVGGGVPGGVGGIGLIGGTAFAITLAEFILKQAGIEKQSGTAPRTSFDTLDKMTKILENKPTQINVNMYDTKLAGDLDLTKLAKQIDDLRKTTNSQVVLE